MDVNDIFEKYSIKEINQRTKISAISLRYIKNKEFDKINRTKFLGFIQILEKEFNTDLSELKSEYDLYYKTHKKKEPEFKHLQAQREKADTKKSSPLKIILTIIGITFLLIIGIIIFIITNTHVKTNNSIEHNKTTSIEYENEVINTIQKESKNTKENTNIKKTQQSNTKSQENPNKNNPINKNISALDINTSTKNIETNQTKPKKEYIVKIIPNTLVWFKAVNLENNKTIEYLTSNPKILIGDDWYIKFGHGNITIQYNDINITPNTKKVVKIILKNGSYHYINGIKK